MRGELCIGAASFLSFAALLMLIFAHIGQINSSKVPRGISMVEVNMSGYGNALAVALGDPIDSLFGFYSFCGSVNGSSGLCSNISAANRFEPFTVILADMPANYSQISESFISMGSFIDSSYLGSFSNGAYYLILIGTVATALAFITGLLKHTLLFLLSTVFAVIAALTLLIGATIWTVIIKKAEGINDFIVGQQNNPAPLGITVTTGNALFLVWASWACQLVSILPYMISCCTYRG